MISNGKGSLNWLWLFQMVKGHLMVVINIDSLVSPLPGAEGHMTNVHIYIRTQLCQVLRVT